MSISTLFHKLFMINNKIIEVFTYRPNRGLLEPLQHNYKDFFFLKVKEIQMSIGTLFHKLFMINNKIIEVFTYRPNRGLLEPLQHNYSYRFCAPHMTNYDHSSTKFCTERLDQVGSCP